MYRTPGRLKKKPICLSIVNSSLTRSFWPNWSTRNTTTIKIWREDAQCNLPQVIHVSIVYQYFWANSFYSRQDSSMLDCLLLKSNLQLEWQRSQNTLRLNYFWENHTASKLDSKILSELIKQNHSLTHKKLWLQQNSQDLRENILRTEKSLKVYNYVSVQNIYKTD